MNNIPVLTEKRNKYQVRDKILSIMSNGATMPFARRGLPILLGRQANGSVLPVVAGGDGHVAPRACVESIEHHVQSGFFASPFRGDGIQSGTKGCLF